MSSGRGWWHVGVDVSVERQDSADFGGWVHNGQRRRFGHSRGRGRVGIAYRPEALAQPFLRSGQLVRVLEDWSPSFEGLFVYCPGHRPVPASLRAFIDTIRATCGSASPRSSRKNPLTGD